MKLENTPGSYGLLAGLLVLLLAAYATSCAHAQAAGRTPAEGFEAAVRIEAVCVAVDGSGTIFGGSGTVVNETTVLTAGHVATDPAGMTCVRAITTSDGKRRLALRGTIDTALDLATLHTLTPMKATPVTFGPMPEYGDRLCAQTAAPMWLRRCGESQYLTTPPGDLVHTIVVEGGNSGSGVYDSRGRLVGVITHRWSCVNGQYCGGRLAVLEGHLHALGL